MQPLHSVKVSARSGRAGETGAPFEPTHAHGMGSRADSVLCDAYVRPLLPRPHPVRPTPRWLNFYFPATRFHGRNDQMFVALTSDQDPRYAERVRYIEEKLKDGVAEEVRGPSGDVSWGSHPVLQWSED